MKKIVFAITSLQLGGAERVLVDMVNRLKDDYDITIFTLYGEGEFLSQVDKKVKCVSLYDTAYEKRSKMQRRFTSLFMAFPFLWKVFYRKHFIKQYDVEIAFLEGPPTWILSCPSSAKKIAWVHNDLEKTFDGGTRNLWKHYLNRKAYGRYQKLIFVSRDNKKAFEKIYPMIKNEKQIIYNYLDCARISKLALEPSDVSYHMDAPVFVSVCRLTEQKGVKRLIHVHKKLIQDGYFHRIYIVGGGPLKVELLDLIDKEKVNDTFVLLGKKENPYPYIKNADYFILASHYEGYGMVLAEAQTLGKPILITDTAAREAVEDYDDVIIMENSEEGIYRGIKKALGEKTKKRKSKKYQNDQIIYDIIKMIED